MMQGNESSQARIAELEARIARLEAANLELEASRNYLRAILDNEPECVKLLSADGTLLEMNPAGLRMLDAESIDQVRNRCVYPVIAEEHREAFRALNEQVMRGGTGTLEFEVVGLKGRRRWLETQASPLRDASGAICATLSITRDITDRRADRNALAERLSELEQLYRTAPVGLALLDRDLRYLRINERLAAINGRTVSEHIGRTVTEIIPEISDLLKSIYTQVFESGQPVLDQEVDLYALDQKTLNGSWLTSYFPVRGQDGQVVAASSVIFEITERKQAELKLREQQRMLSESQRIARIGSWRLDTEGRRTWSEETFRLFGLVPGPSAPDTDAFIDLIHPEDREGMRRWVAAVSTGAAVEDPEYRVILGDGSVRHLIGRGEPQFDAEGRFAGVAGTVQDVTERKLAQAALERSRELLELFVEHSPAAIAMFDRDMNYILASRRYRADYGVGDESLAGRNHYEVFPDLPERWKQAHRRCLAGATEKSEDDTYETADGQVYQVRWEIHPWREPDGEIGGILLFAETLSELKKAQKRLEQSLARQRSLARRLTEAQEVERRRLSSELHDRLGQNLTALGINLNIIGSRFTEPADPSALRLHDSRKLLETTIASVRDLISELRPPALDDYGLLAGLRWYAEQVRDRSGLAVSVQGTEPAPRLESRAENALFRIAQEALTNVVKHAGAAQVAMALDCDAERVRLSIADDGRGFDTTALPQASPRAHWGLEMIHERAVAIGAGVKVESSVGGGTRVTVELDTGPRR